MGKQIEFFIEYELFVSVAQKALDCGCKIIKVDTVKGVVTESDSVDVISSDLHGCWYYFHVPEAGGYRVDRTGEREQLDHGYSSSGNTLIEASPTRIRSDEKKLTRGRLYCISGYYDEDGQWIERPDCVTKIYNSLARYVKKIAPYTEVDHYVVNPVYAGRKVMSKEYISKECLSLVKDQDYTLG